MVFHALTTVLRITAYSKVGLRYGVSPLDEDNNDSKPPIYSPSINRTIVTKPRESLIDPLLCHGKRLLIGILSDT